MRLWIVVVSLVVGMIALLGCPRGEVEISVEERNMAIVRTAHASLASGYNRTFILGD